MVRQKNISDLWIYLNQTKRFDIETYACQLFILVMRTDFILKNMDVKKVMTILLRILFSESGVSKHSYYSIQTLAVLERE